MAGRVAPGPPGVGVGAVHIPEKEKGPPSSPKETPACGLVASTHHPLWCPVRGTASPSSQGGGILPLGHLSLPPPSSALPVVPRGLPPLSGSTGEPYIYLENQCEHLPCAQTVRSKTEALKASFLSQSPPPLVFGDIRVCGRNSCLITKLCSTGAGSWHIVGGQQIFVD